MKGIGWDDLGKIWHDEDGQANVGEGHNDESRDLRVRNQRISEMKFYEGLKKSLRTEGISYEYTSEYDEFFSRATSGEFDFATVDLMVNVSAGGTKSVGKDLAARLSNQRKKMKDPDFPVFILSSTPESFGIDDALLMDVALIKKDNEAPSFTASVMIDRLRAAGRFVRYDEVLILGRHAAEDLAGRKHNIDHMDDLSRIVRESKYVPKQVLAQNIDHNILDDLRSRISESRKVVVLVSADERIDGADEVSLARPNVYLELGLALGMPGTARKLIVIKQESAFLPTNIGSYTPIPFKICLDEISGKIKEKLDRL